MKKRTLDHGLGDAVERALVAVRRIVEKGYPYRVIRRDLAEQTVFVPASAKSR